MHTLEEIYGMSRKEYYSATGTTPEDMIQSLDNECIIMELNLEKLRLKYRKVDFCSKEGRYLAKLMSVIGMKIAQKRAKIKDIMTNDF